MCKTIEDYAEGRGKTGREEERRNVIRKMLESGLSREIILSMHYSEQELKEIEKELPVRVYD